MLFKIRIYLILIAHLYFFVIKHLSSIFFFFFLNDPATPEIYPFPLPHPLPISPRFDPSGKQFRYFIYNPPAMDPLLRAQAWHVPPSLDLAKMRQAARHFIGKHDFEAFAAN